MKRSSGKVSSWKTKKHLAVVLCVVVIMLSMSVSLYFQIINNLDEKEDISVALQSAHANVVNYGNSASLSMNSSAVKDTAGTAASPNSNSGGSNDIKRNHVVYDIQQTGTDAPNRVVRNPSTYSLVSGAFENNGTPLEWEDSDTLYQYPVELGYPVDNNYDGRQTEKGIIRDYDFNPPKDDELYSDNRDKEDQIEEAEESVTEETTEDTTEEKTVNNELQKKIWNTMFSAEPVQVDMPVKIVQQNVKRSATKSRKKSTKTNTNFIEAMMDALQHKVGAHIEGDTETPSDGKNVEGDTESPVDEKKAETDTETPVDEEKTETDTETPVDEEKTETDTETPVDEEKTENDTEVPSDGDDAEQTSETNKIQPDSSFFIVSGKMRADSQVFVSDITVKPTGKDGFDQVRIGKDGDFQSFVTLTEDADEKEVTLYFSDGEKETAGVTFAYSKDTSNPSMSLDGASFHILRSGNTNIYCTNNAELDLILEDGNNATGVDKICYVYGDRVTDFTNITGGAKAALPQDFYGSVFMNCADKAGNTSSVLSEYILLDRVAPKMEFSQDEFCTIPYTLWVDVADNGSIVSGLADVTCIVNGEPMEITNLETKGTLKLEDDLEVPQRMGFSMTFAEEGEFAVQVKVTDYTGNTTVEERNITVTKPEFVSVFMPETFTIHIDPQRLLEREPIFSDNIELINVSEFDVKVTVDSIELYVNDEVSPEGIEKDCEIYFVTPDTGEKIKLEKGKNKDVYSYCLPENAVGDIANLYFVGSTTEGSEEMWQDSDISIVVNLSFRKWRGE